MTERVFRPIHDGLTEALRVARGLQCPHCHRTLTIVEQIERHCAECGKDTRR